jgi:hypothetical protein
MVSNYSINVFVTWYFDPFHPIRWGMVVVLVDIILPLANQVITSNNTADIAVFIVRVD